MAKNENGRRHRMNTETAKKLGLKLNKSNRYRLTKKQEQQYQELKKAEVKHLKVSNSNKTKPNDYKEPQTVLSAWDNDGFMMNIDQYCKHYGLPKEDISSYKLVSHTGTPFYNIVFKERFNTDSIDFEGILNNVFKKDFKELKTVNSESVEFDSLTYTDVHIGMDTDSKGNSMYATEWNRESILDSLDCMINEAINNKQSETIVVDELGDFLDGFNGYTTRGGHKLPQNMTDEEVFDLGLNFKIELAVQLSKHYKEVIINNICNDNHAGAFGYFVNSAFARWSSSNLNNVKVVNHRKFMNHYFIGSTCFIITHGKDDSTLKFGFKPQLDSKGLEKIDQYCKQNGIYKKANRIIFKKGDSHQALFDMCTSDDFYYFNYPALSPSSQWVQNNFKKGRRGFVLETFTENKNTFNPIFL